MAIVILDGMEIESDISEILVKILEEKEETYEYFMLNKMHIEPCWNCGGCRTKTPGQCIFDDDIHKILSKVVRDNRIIMLTSIRFGGYNAQLKKALDKFALLGLPLFTVKKGRLAHVGAYGTGKLLNGVVIGVSKSHMEDQKESFRYLVHENNEIMDADLKALILENGDVREKKEKQLRGIMEEAFI